MKTYDLIAIGSGSAMNIVEAMLQEDPGKKVAVVDKDDPGGICLTRGCIPTKILVYPAEIRRTLEEGASVGVDARIRQMDFMAIMERMRSIVDRDVEEIRTGLSGAKGVDYYRDVAEFVSPYQLRVGSETITSKMIFLCLGSRPLVPPIHGLTNAGYYTSDTILGIERLPKTLAIVGGGYIAAEFGHFFSAMGSKVTVVGRNPRFLPSEEPEISELAEKEMSRFMTILTNHEVVAAEPSGKGKKTLRVKDRASGRLKTIGAEEILLALGRASNADLLHPERAGIQTDEKGWIAVNEYLETSQPNIWALGDAVGKQQFKHVANYESKVVYYNAVLGQRVKVDYHAVPHAVFSYPEIASVGLRQKEAVDAYGEDGVLIGFQRHRNTAKGEAMGLRDSFVKVLVEEETTRILGAHVIGPQASVLIQEIVTLMYTEDGSMKPILTGMHIHPALTEVVERAFTFLMRPHEYEHMREQGLI
jgi:mycothione reductase